MNSNTTFISKFSEPTPSDESREFDFLHCSKAHSGTSLASHSRRTRLKELGQTVPSAGSGTVSNGGGGEQKVSVLAKVSMFEEHNKRVSSSIISTPNKKISTGGIVPGSSSSVSSSYANKSSPARSDAKDDKSLKSNSTRTTVPSSINTDSEDFNQHLGEEGINDTYSPSKARRSRTIIPEDKLSPTAVGKIYANNTAAQESPRYSTRYRPRSQSATNTTEVKAPSSPYIKTETSSGSIESSQSERRKKRHQAKQFAVTTSGTEISQGSDEHLVVSRTPNRNILSKSHDPDPLDREGQAKNNLLLRKKFELDTSMINNSSVTPSVPPSPTRRRKLKNAGDKLKRDRQRDINSDMSHQSLTPVKSPRNSTSADRNKQWDRIDLGGKMEGDSSYTHSQKRHGTVSPSLLPEKRDRLRSEMNQIDLSPAAHDDDLVGRITGGRSSSRKNRDSSSASRRRKSKKLVDGMPPAQLDFELQKIGDMSSNDRMKQASPSSRTYHYDGSKYADPLNLSYISEEHQQQQPTLDRSSHHRASPLQNQDFFAPITVQSSPKSYHDEDDETQFNSVNMQDNHDRSKSKDPASHYDRFHASNNNATASRGVDRDNSSSYYGGSSPSPITMLVDENTHGGNGSSNFSYQSQSMNHHVPMFQNGHGMDDDAESYTDSVTNGSWTGRMRARQRVEEAMAEEAMFVDQRIDSRLSGTGSKHSIHGRSDDYVSVSSRVLNNVSKQPHLVVTDARKGMEEMKNYANEDPKSVAMGLGVVSALCGAILFGPVGFVLGAGSVGVGYKVMQMPEEQRSEVKESANSAMKKLQDSAVAANDALQSTCATACGNPKEDEDDIPTHIVGQSPRPRGNAFVVAESSAGVAEERLSPRQDTAPRGMPLKVSNLNPNPQDLVPRVITEQKAAPRKTRRITPACRRMGRITPVSQIHSLDPALHPRAWLDVMASAWTSREEKNEAMEEILLLAKDKNHARMLLEEGILDSLMYIIRGFFSHYADVQRKTGQASVPVETYMADLNFIHAKLASACCLALGKAHCAVVHTHGEEMIAATVHVKVPVAKQISQMLYEVPHHTAVITNDEGEKKEIFKLTTEMSTNQAEALASSILALSMGKVELTLEEM